MAGAACKVIINQLLAALSEAIEEILLNPSIYQPKLSEDVRDDLIQRHADCDLALYGAKEMPLGGLMGIMEVLDKHGLISADVWMILRKPGE